MSVWGPVRGLAGRRLARAAAAGCCGRPGQWRRSTSGKASGDSGATPPMSPSPTTAGPLAGVRVLDLTRILAGPYCTMLLADQGAEVIKVERPGQGDDTRGWGPPFAGTESCYYLAVNRNKHSICVDLKTAAGREVIEALVLESDVLVENFVPGTLAKLGLGYDDCRALNPRLVYTSITGYSSTGPYADRAAYDVMVAAMGGLLHITGTADEPCKPGVALTDISTGLFCQGAISSALFARERTGRGQHIECSLLESQVALLSTAAVSHLVTKQEPRRWTTAHASIVPYQAFRTADGHFVLGALNDPQFETLCTVLGDATLSSRLDDFRTNAARVRQRDELVGVLQGILAAQPTAAWLARLDGSGLPFSRINTLEEVFDDPQVQHLGMVAHTQHPTAGELPLVRNPVRLSETPIQSPEAPPVLNQDRARVLRDVLHFSPERVADVTRRGAFGRPPAS